MSKIREQISIATDELKIPREGDLCGYVIFTQLKKDGPFIYAGWLDAPDDEMALILAKEHYGQDQECAHIWAVRRQFVGGLRENIAAASEKVAEPREYQTFIQKNAGDQHVSAGVVTARCATDATRLAREQAGDAGPIHDVWAVPTTAVISTADDDLIWRTTDQTYRLARGYSKDVRDKWEKIRAEQDLKEYEKDDLKETF